MPQPDRATVLAGGSFGVTVGAFPLFPFPSPYQRERDSGQVFYLQKALAPVLDVLRR